MFEFDKNKSSSNKKKHGISFEDALTLWEDPDRIILKAKQVEEERYLLIGRINRKIWSAIYTYRAEHIRIISVRKSRNNEKEIYFRS